MVPRAALYFGSDGCVDGAGDKAICDEQIVTNSEKSTATIGNKSLKSDQIIKARWRNQ